MQTYLFTALRDERYAANGTVQADSAEEARNRILERYDEEGLNFRDYVDGGYPDHIMLSSKSGEEFDFEDATPPDLACFLKALVEKADDLVAAIEGVTDQFETEVSALADAASAAEKAMNAAGGAA